MSSVSERQCRLVLDLLRDSIPEDEFYRAFPCTPGDAGEIGLVMLRRAVDELDPLGIEFGLYLGHRFGISRKYLDILLVLAEADWHESHSDVVDGLATLSEPESVDVFFRVALAKHPYLEYDDAFALGVKCIYALARIQNKEAVVCLGELLRSGNSVLEAQAVARLARIECSGKNEAVRTVAREILALHGAGGIDR